MSVQTVLGPIDPSLLGNCLTHEHLLHGLPDAVFKKPIPQSIQHLKQLPMSMETLGWIRQYPYSYDDNLEFSDEPVRNAVKDEMLFYKKNGGDTLVENSSIGLRTDDQHQFLKKIAQTTGVNIVLGTGFYVHSSQKSSTLKMTKEKMIEKIKKELLEGVGETDIKCGVIGEVGCSWPLLEFERNSLESSAQVQEEIGCPVIIHPARHKDSPREIIRIFQEAGGRVSNTVMSHLDRTLFCEEDFAEFASLGSYCEMDLFGIEVSHYQQDETRAMPSDSQRIYFLKYLVEQGFQDKIVISHDIHTKHRLMKFGGHGYSHILINVVPMMVKRGINKDVVKKMLVDNPRRWLTCQ